MKAPSRPVSLKPSPLNILRYDGPAGTVVFLVALPLCLGIALASGAPLFAGIIAGCVGGIVISLLSGSHVSVSGPAAGLTVIVSHAILDLGSFETFLLAVVIAGAMQLAMGIARLGAIGDYVPNSVIRGMLAAIGLVIILKQIPHALGFDADYEGDFRFFEGNERNTLTTILASVFAPTPGALIISLVSLAILVTSDRLKARGNRFFKIIPGPLLVVFFGILANQLFRIFVPGLYISSTDHMVSLPAVQSIGEYFSQFMSPNFGAIGNGKVWSVAVTLAIVASLESLISLEAADRIDPYRRISPPSRELCAQGIGNMISGLLGGLPVTSVVVRTSANIYAGARTRMASFIHGLFLLGSSLFIPSLLNLTPLATLAAILIVVGFKLTTPKLYRDMYRQGYAQFLPFIITVLAIVFTDLLTGVLIGIACGFFFVIRANHHDAFTVVNNDNQYLMRFNKDASFVNKAELREKLRNIPESSHLIVDAQRALYIDNDIIEVFEDFRKLAPYEKITLDIENLERGRAKISENP